jgi:RNA polymerase sigma-54 factor
VNPVYQALMKREKNYDEETVKFVEQKLNSALWVIKSIEQRRLTLYKVVNCIISFQREFFERGLKALKPLTLKQVADVLGIHESTVSRATAHKYVQTPLGVFELKFFFANGVESSQGTSTSAQSVKATIQELVDSEDPRRPYTDQQLAELLTQRGISISRRTVTKYRDEQGIPAAAKRKRF